MDSSPRCQRKRAIFCRFISTAHTISSWKGYWKRLTSGSSTSISISSSFFFFFFFPLVGGSLSWEEKKNNYSHQFLIAHLTTAPCTEQVLTGHINIQSSNLVLLFATMNAMGQSMHWASTHRLIFYSGCCFLYTSPSWKSHPSWKSAVEPLGTEGIPSHCIVHRSLLHVELHRLVCNKLIFN